MTATAAEALELALWLHRVPARRVALAGRPLPDGIGPLLRVAGGAPDQVAAAARITGVEEATILEAVRFYLQQVLFHEDADAYRVLGLRHDASQERAREHHRLLQQWLHPDRSGQDAWESVYAVRINQAWGQLRTPQARAAYDAAIRVAGSTVHVPAPSQRDAGASRAIAGSDWGSARRSRSRNLTVAVLLGCVGLLVLIAVRREAPPQWPETRPVLAERSAAAVDEADPPLAALGAVLTQAIGGGEAVALPVVSETTPVPESSAAGVGPPVVGASVAPPMVAVIPAKMSPEDDRAGKPRGTPPLLPVPASVAPAPAARPVATTGTPDPVLPSPSEALAAREGPAALAAVGEAAPTRIPDAFGRMNQAQARAAEILAYFGNPTSGVPPVWNDVPTMQQAERIRMALYGRNGDPGRMRFELQGPQWRLSAGGARLESGYRAGSERGRIGLDFTWRESQLLVSAISLEPDA